MITEKLKVSQFLGKYGKILSCLPDDEISKVKSLMLLNDFSQIPVLQESGKIMGAVSWKSIGKAEALGTTKGFAHEYMEDPAIIKDSVNFLDYIKLVAKKDYVLVTNAKGDLKGIITTYDMTIYFKEFITPFLKLGIIEDNLRRVITTKDLQTPRDVNELVFSQYEQIFKQHDNWEKLKLPNLNQQVFLEKLGQLRIIRNKVAHYKPDPLTEDENFVIASFAEIISKLAH